MKNKNRYEEKQEIRLNKYLAESGICSRRGADELIKQGVVKVNKKTISELGTKIHLGDDVTVKGDPVSRVTKRIYILLNKPKDTITSLSDEMGRQTVMDIVKKQTRIFPVGRLDRNTTGVLLLTNDGEMAYRLTHPKFEVARSYKIRIDKDLKIEDARKIAKGVELEDGKTKECDVLIHPKDKTDIIITLREGKNREVRRLFEAFGYKVKKLDRKEFAGLTNKGLNRGEYRHLTKSELMELKRMLDLK